MKRASPERLLYLSPSPLSSFAQRPHHFVHWFHQRFDAPVFWIDPGPSRLPRASDWPRLVRYMRRISDRLKGRTPPPALGPIWRHEAWLSHVTAQVLPLEPFALGRRINQLLWHSLFQRTDAFVNPDTVLVMGKPCALSLALLKRYPQNHCVFDAMDYMPGFCTGVSRQWMVQAETQLARQSHAIWASSHALAHGHAQQAGKVRLVLNALTTPPDQTLVTRAIRSVPVLGYLGVIDRWFDWALVNNMARQHPEVLIRLIGPIHCAPPMALPANVQCLPPVPQHQVYEAMSSFDVGLIPFALNDVTRYVDPVKYYEYRALGLPVLSTRFGEMAHRSAGDGVYFWDQLQNAEIGLSFLLKARADEQERQTFCANNTWAQRFDAHAHTLVAKR